MIRRKIWSVLRDPRLLIQVGIILGGFIFGWGLRGGQIDALRRDVDRIEKYGSLNLGDHERRNSAQFQEVIHKLDQLDAKLQLLIERSERNYKLLLEER